MNRAFILDMDGVIIDTERLWRQHAQRVIGKEVNDAMQGKVEGLTMKRTYQLAREKGLAMGEDEFYEHYNKIAWTIYPKAKMSVGIERLLDSLKELNYKVGLVSSSSKLRIGWVLARLANAERFDYVLSIGDNPELQSKPAPDGYLQAIKELGSTPVQTIIVEDSNNGIASAKASGAYAIGFRQHHDAEYQLKGADKYVDSMNELEEYIRNR